MQKLVSRLELQKFYRTENYTCLEVAYNSGRMVNMEIDFLMSLEQIILDRKANRPQGSYTVSLIDAGEDEILKKIGEEAIEVIVAKNQGDGRIVSEIADLIYHLQVLLVFRDLSMNNVIKELKSRRSKIIEKNMQ